ncbi:hypothetical protein BKI52_19755 [marine bacterium AO1-C]|nr:hypothetical protein BKI52_19755 [marine bacterium AO1-C]
MELYQHILQQRHTKTIQTTFPESFIIYQPREYLGGDFLWAVRQSKKVMIVTGDCIGHGILGATGQFFMLTMLNELVMENPAINADELVMKIDEIVQEHNKGEDTVNMRVEMMACFIEPEKRHMCLAGLYQEALLFRNGEITRFQGRAGKLKPAEIPVHLQAHCMKYHPGDRLYFFTDGYYDQFGGEKGLKFLRRRFFEKLSSIQPLSMGTQKEDLEHTMQQWMHQYEEQQQTDDMLIIGLEL